MDETTLLSIKEFSDFTGVKQSTLRYYDDIGLLPANVRGENNYRYYTPFQVIKLNYINVLVNLDVPLSVIKDMNKERTPKAVINLLSKQEMNLDKRLHELWDAYTVIHTFRKNIQEGFMVQDGLIRVEYMEEMNYILGDKNNFAGKDTFYEEFIRFCRASDENMINLNYPVGGYHDDLESFVERPGKPDRYLSMDPRGNKTRPAGKYLVGYELGYYGNFGDIPKNMAAYAREKNLVCKGPLFVLYLFDEISIINPDEYLCRVSVSVD